MGVALTRAVLPWPEITSGRWPGRVPASAAAKAITAVVALHLGQCGRTAHGNVIDTGVYNGEEPQRPLDCYGPAGEYSRKVPQLVRTRGDLRGRGRTMTCIDARGWTCCLLMACKRSAVRARLAPGQTSNSNSRIASTAARVPQPPLLEPPYVCSDRASSPGQGCWHDAGFQALNQRWLVSHLRKSPRHRSSDSCRLGTTRPS
jgi:hypothetical protein